MLKDVEDELQRKVKVIILVALSKARSTDNAKAFLTCDVSGLFCAPSEYAQSTR